MNEMIAMALAVLVGLAIAVLAVWYAVKKGWPVPKDGDEV